MLPANSEQVIKRDVKGIIQYVFLHALMMVHVLSFVKLIKNTAFKAVLKRSGIKALAKAKYFFDFWIKTLLKNDRF